MSMRNIFDGRTGRFVSLTSLPSWVLSVLGFVLLFLAWFVATEYELVATFLVPTPAAVWGEFARLWDLILANLWITLFESAVGFVAAVALSLVLGLFITMSRPVHDTLMPVIIGGNSVPRIAVAPLIIFYLGGGMASKYVIAAWIAFFPMLINTIEGLSLEDDDRQDMLALYDATTWQEYRLVRFPSAIPHLFDGMKLAVSLAIIGAIVGEFIAAEEGLGSLVVWSLWNHNIAQALAIVFVMGVTAMVAILGLYVIQDRIVFWRQTNLFGGES